MEPQSEIGAPSQRIEGDGLNVADRAELHREIARNSGARIIAYPHLALDAITHQQSTFTRRDMAMFTPRDMIEAEQRAHCAAEQCGLVRSGEHAIGHDFGIVVGYAWTGKSTMLGVAREAWAPVPGVPNDRLPHRSSLRNCWAVCGSSPAGRPSTTSPHGP